ncbi:hypothetical protein [Paenibacillus borealis]|nr:hypothetical protein [Paenibacillus borealis]
MRSEKSANSTSQQKTAPANSKLQLRGTSHPSNRKKAPHQPQLNGTLLY